MELISEADVVLCLGTRLNPFSTLPGYGINYWPNDAKLIQVDINADRILVRAEATNRQLANRFVNDVKNNKTLVDYTWDHPPFKMDKSGIVTLELKGKYIYGTT